MQRTRIRRIKFAVLCVAPTAFCVASPPTLADEGIRLKPQLTLLTLPPARDDPAPLFMEADTLRGHSEQETEAEGNVRLRRLGQSFSAEWMRYDAPTQEVEAKGRVRMEYGGDVIEGDNLRLNLGTERGFMEKPSFKLTPIPRDYVPPGGSTGAFTSPSGGSTGTSTSPSRAYPAMGRGSPGAFATGPSGTFPSNEKQRVPLQGRGDADRLLFQGPDLYSKKKKLKAKGIENEELKNMLKR